MDEVGDAADALFDGVDQLHAGDEGFEPTQGIREHRAVEVIANALEFFGVHADRDQCGRHLPRILDVGGLHPLGESLFGVALFERVHSDRLVCGERLLLQVEHAELLFLGQVAFFEFE